MNHAGVCKGGDLFAKELKATGFETEWTGGDMETAKKLHAVANKECFVANSLNCPVEHEPTIEQD